MVREDVELIIEIVTLLIRYGKPMVESFVNALEKDVITLEDLQNMKITKRPEEYFPKYKRKKQIKIE